MDGSEKQAEMSDVLRAQVKQGSTARRDTDFTVQVFSRLNNLQRPDTTASRPESSSAEPRLGQTKANGALAVDFLTLDETDNFLITLYLDTVFPFLFPWYQPPTLSGGRSWVLALLKANKAIFHTAMSLSSYYFTLLLARDAKHTIRTPCEQHVWETLARHMDLSMQVVRDDLNVCQADTGLVYQAHVLEGIMHLLVFETSMAKDADWNLHLSAALMLFDRIFQAYGMRDGRYHLSSVLLAMHKPSFLDDVVVGVPIWNTDQAAFQFSTALLVYADVISSIPLRKPPRLRQLYKYLILDDTVGSDSSDDPQQLLQMESYIGCPGWILVVIGEISALEAWKHSSSSHEWKYLADGFARWGIDIEEKLERGMRHAQGFTGPFDSTTPADMYAVVTKTWMHASRIYLTTVREGWQSANLLVRSDVESALDLLHSLPAQLCLRSLMWPFCISGFMAAAEQEQSFRNIVSAMGPLQTFGTAKKALELMERVWEIRDQLDGNLWGIADCFEAKEHTILVI